MADRRYVIDPKTDAELAGIFGPRPPRAAAPRPQAPLAGSPLANPFAILNMLGLNVGGQGSVPQPQPTATQDGVHSVRSAAGNFVDQISDMFTMRDPRLNAPPAAPAPAPNAFAAPSSAAPAGPRPMMGGDPYQIFKQAIIGQESGGRYGVANTEGSGAMGIGQVMPKTGRTLAGRIGLPWRPELMSGTSPEARQYQDKITEAAVQDAWRFGGGDPAMAAKYYFAGPDRKGWGPKTDQYAQDIARRMGNPATGGVPMPQFQGSFDPGMWQGALGQIDAATQAQMTPTDQTFNTPAAPIFPDAPQMPTRDFAGQDQRMQAMKPVLDLERDRPRIERANLFAGLAKGLAATEDGAGLGKVLGNIGAGLLAGRAAADSELQSRVDEFDKKMLAWQQAEFNYEGAKSEALHGDAVKQVGMIWQHNLQKFSADTAQFNKDNSIDLAGGQFIIRSRTDAGLRVQTVPFKPYILARGAMAKSGIMTGMATANQASSAITANANNQIMAGIFADQYSQARVQAAGPAGQPGGGIEGYLGNALNIGSTLVDKSLAPSILGQGAYDQILSEAQAQAQKDGHMMGSPEFVEATKGYVAANISIGMMRSPELMKRIQQIAPQLYTDWLMTNTKTQSTTTRDAKGRTTTQTRNAFDAN